MPIPIHECDHPESKQYVIALDEDASTLAILTGIDGLFGKHHSTRELPRKVPCITWCRGCGGLRGWKPSDAPSSDEWQLPDLARPEAT